MNTNNESSIFLVKGVSNLVIDHYKKIENQEISGYIKHQNGKYYVAIPFNGTGDYLDQFVGFTMESGPLRLNSGTISNGLFLSADENIDLDRFAYVAVDFLKLANRQKIISEPYDWSDSWRAIFGDSLGHEQVASVLGELISLYFVYQKDKTAVWQGPLSGSQDISCSGYDVEVKTTTEKKVSRITINSAIQLGGTKKQYLYFVRMEKKPYANFSIDAVVSKLSDIEYPISSIEDLLKKKNMPRGMRLRKEEFDLIEVKSYEVTAKNFPLFDLKKLNDLSESKNIIDFSLTIDLNAAPSTLIYSKK